MDKTRLLKPLHPVVPSPLFPLFLRHSLLLLSVSLVFLSSFCSQTFFHQHVFFFLSLQAQHFLPPSLFPQVPGYLSFGKPLFSPLPLPLCLFTFFLFLLTFFFFLPQPPQVAHCALHLCVCACVCVCVCVCVCANELRAVSLPRWGAMLGWSALLELQVSTTNTCQVERYLTHSYTHKVISSPSRSQARTHTHTHAHKEENHFRALSYSGINAE